VKPHRVIFEALSFNYYMIKYLLLSALFLVFSCDSAINSNPGEQLSEKEISMFKNQIVRYFEGSPKHVNRSQIFDSEHDSYYQAKANSADLMHYYVDKDGFTYFAVARIAPSLKFKKVATIGRLKMGKDSLIYYEEICRTWKMDLPELSSKTKILFDNIVNKKDVSKYYTKNSQPDYWIEFPDEKNFYNTKDRAWSLKEIK
jgi:hypothetical protein